jgi:hypothetical protein
MCGRLKDPGRSPTRAQFLDVLYEPVCYHWLTDNASGIRVEVDFSSLSEESENVLLRLLESQ